MSDRESLAWDAMVEEHEDAYPGERCADCGEHEDRVELRRVAWPWASKWGYLLCDLCEEASQRDEHSDALYGLLVMHQHWFEVGLDADSDEEAEYHREACAALGDVLERVDHG